MLHEFLIVLKNQLTNEEKKIKVCFPAHDGYLDNWAKTLAKAEVELLMLGSAWYIKCIESYLG